MNDNAERPPSSLTRRGVLIGGAAAAGAALTSGLLGSSSASAAQAVGPQILVDLLQPGSDFPHVWERAIAGDWAKQALRRDYQDQLFTCHDELGMQSLRTHGIFNTSMSTADSTFNGGRTRNPAYTQDNYSWFNITQIYDALVDHNMHPFVELSSMPESLQLSAPPFRGLLFDFNQMPPADFAAWGKLVGAFAKHMVDRYGIAEVRKWPFEVWNEPNLFTFYDGDQQSYFNLYRSAAEAIKNVDASLQVGGPATSAGQFSFGPPRMPGTQYYREFMQWATANNVPVDFGTAHGYETDRNIGPEGTASFFKQNRADTPAGRPLYITEVNVSSTNDPKLDKSDAAASFLRTVIETVGVVDALAIWTFSDIYEELTQADNPFHGGFGIQTIHGIKKPLYRLLQILHGVGDKRVPLALTGAPSTVGGIAVTDAKGAVDVLLYNHALAGPHQAPAQPATLTVNLSGVAPGAKARVQYIDEDHTNPYREWLELNSPEYPTRPQLRAISDASELHDRRLDITQGRGRGDLSFMLTLPAEGVAAVHISRGN
ncbi:GH39 family glycosyl hydrolase [Pengzhenrongella sp.]|jgi:xylan 1,4-beta-xylosidase|uniref:GH39 family glycosyl hydrolase n=1 Tax=Pengzhenrongella sp. TaxID=2888820 RepID=UPI002F95D1B8